MTTEREMFYAQSTLATIVAVFGVSVDWALRRCLNIASDGADVTCGGRLLHKLAPETGKARFPTVERLNSGTASWLEKADGSLRRDGTSVTRVKYDDRYVGALPFRAR